MTVSLEQFSGLVSGIYGAALEPERWEPALRSVVAAMGGEGGALLLAEPRSRRFWNTAFGIEASMVASYDAHYGRLDPVPPVLERAPAGAVFGSHEVIDHDAMRRSEFYADWAGPVGTGGGMFASLLRDGRGVAWFVCSAPLRQERFATAERLRLMRLLVPHLQQALRAQLELDEAVHAKGRAFDAFEHARHGMAWVGTGGGIVHTNAAAIAILRRGEGLALQADGCLRASLAGEDAALQRAIALDASGDADGVFAGGSLTISRPHGRLPLAAHVLPVLRGSSDLDHGEAMALVVLVDIEERVEPRPELLRQFFGLTRAEATVAVATLRCDTLQAVADELSVSLSTVRTHLQRAYDKTGVHRQADLAILVAAIEGGLIRPEVEQDRNH